MAYPGATPCDCTGTVPLDRDEAGPDGAVTWCALRCGGTRDGLYAMSKMSAKSCVCVCLPTGVRQEQRSGRRLRIAHENNTAM